MALSDHNILTKLRSEDNREVNEASSLLYSEHFSMVRHHVNTNSGTDADAKDVFQEIQFNFIKKVQEQNFILTCKIRTFLFAMARNVWLKKLSRKKNIEALDKFKERDLIVEHNALAKLITRERAELVRKMMMKLDPDCAKVLTLYYYKRWDMESIAREMKYANAQVAKNKKCQSVKKLRDFIVAHENQNPT